MRRSPPSSRSASRIAGALALALAAGAPGRSSAAPLPTERSAWSVLESKATAIADRNHSSGWAYVISGGVALAGSIPGYYLSEDVFARAVYSVGQTLGVAAIGYGSYLVLVDDDATRFQRIVSKVETLSARERNELAAGFLLESADRARAVRRIRVITHGLTAGLNFLNGATTSHRELKTALFFLGGINTIAALSFGLTRSEEEKLTETWSIGLGAGGSGGRLALRLRF